jgi:hypothetical protein
MRNYGISMASEQRRPALEVLVNDVHSITIRQDVDGSTERSVVIDPEDVSTLIQALETARREARHVASPEREEVTVPAFKVQR